MKKLYCAGTFPFDYQNERFFQQASQDYRSKLLGSTDLLLTRSNGIQLKDDLIYIGPFYFEAPEMTDVDIVHAEQNMVKNCTHAIFLLDDGCCPGTITELTAAALLGKQIAIFYVRRPDNEENESPLHSPCWYPICFCKLQNPQTVVFACESSEDAAEKILKYVDIM